jgi:hypothetical protein
VDTQDEGLALEDHELHVRLDEDEEVSCGLDELTHAYAVRIHRAQGSEYPCVVVPVTTSAWLMLQRNLLYTSVIRAKRLVVLVGSRRALAKAVRTRARSAATPPSPNGSSRTGEDRCGSQPALGGPADQVAVEPEERIRDPVAPAGRSGCRQGGAPDWPSWSP